MITGLFNQSLSIYPTSTYSADGRITFGSTVAVKGRIQEKTIRRLMPNNEILVIDAIAYVPSDTTVATNSKLVHGSNNYKVIGKYQAVDDLGDTNHIKLELQKWI